MKFYSRYNKGDIGRIIYQLRRNPLDKSECVIKLDDNLYFQGTRARCYLNAMIFSILDQYSVPKDNRTVYIFKDKIFKKDVISYMNRCMSELLKVDFPHKNIMLSHILADIKSSFGYISLICNDVVTIDHSIYDYVIEYRNNPEFRKLFTDPLFSPTDDVWTIRNKVNAIIDKFRNGTINLQPLSDFLKYGVKVKPEQLLMFFSYDLAPDPLRSNRCLRPLGVSIVNGISTVWAVITLDNISRLAIVSSKTEIKITGVQSKRISTALQSTKINMADTRASIEDCGNTDYLSFEIRDSKDLSFFRFKYFYDPETHEKLGWIDEDRFDLIGKTVHIRSFILCKTPIVCKECYGYNWEMVADTELYKGNLSLCVLEEFNKKMQSVISVKHHSGWVYTDMEIRFKGMNTTMEWMLKNTDYFESIDWNKIRINPKYKVEFYPYEVEEDKKGRKTFHKERLFIDGHEIYTDQTWTKLDDYTFSYTVPNNSVLLQAEALKVAINKHSTKDRDTGKTDFDASMLKDKSLSEQAKLMFLYQKGKVKLDHFIYYEAILHALVRDASNPALRVTEDTTDITMIHADSVLTKADRSSNISTTLPHGYINNIFNTINQNCTPSEYDILYNNLTDRKILKKNIFADFNNILNTTTITNNNNVRINERDENVSTADLLYSDRDDD